MANKFFSDVAPKPKGEPRIVKKRMSEDRGTFMEKAAFPAASVPGKTQPRDRSGGVAKAPVSPKKIGL